MSYKKNKNILDLRNKSDKKRPKKSLNVLNLKKDTDFKKDIAEKEINSRIRSGSIANKQKENVTYKQKSNPTNSHPRSNNFLKQGCNYVSYTNYSNKRLLKNSFSGKLRDAIKFVSFKKVFILSIFLIFILLFPQIIILVDKALLNKDEVERYGLSAYDNLKEAQASIKEVNFEQADQNFDSAYENFLQAGDKLDEISGDIGSVLKFLPGISQIESGKHLANAGQEISLAGKELTQAAKVVIINKEKIKYNINLNDTNNQTDFTFIQMVESLRTNLQKAYSHLETAEKELEEVDLKHIKGEQKEKIQLLKNNLPAINDNLEKFISYTDLFNELLGENGARKYLIIFQNNHEIRATGGFIGTYGLIKVDNGRVEKIKIDGIYNPDGQLSEKVIPPKPLQKVTSHWSMRDANWWPNYPRSAEKVAWFFEKSTGQTVDGVISVTPRVMMDLLKLTGPITVEGYGQQGALTISSQNFMDTIQQQVEVDYDREENRPKKILADMTPLFFEKIFQTPTKKWSEMLNILSNALSEKHIMLYSFDPRIEQIITDMGWSGKILETDGDYLLVVNSNIGSFKTDGVIDQEIEHTAQLLEDGTILVNLKISRKHNGGEMEKEWFNVRNSSWMRIYVPKGSQLISGEGFATEFNKPQIDFESQNYISDPNIVKAENNAIFDETSKVQIYEEDNKTVFANWSYVNPGESTTINLKYILPFRINLNNIRNPVDRYSLLLQKQPGDDKTTFKTSLKGLEDCEYFYKQPQDLIVNKEGWTIEGRLDEDRLFGLIIGKRD